MSEIGHKVYQLTTKGNPPCNSHINPFTYITPVSPMTKQPTIENASKRKWTFLSVQHNTQKESKLGRTLCATIKIFLHGEKGLMRNQNDLFMQNHYTENSKMLLVKVQFVSLNVIEPYKEVQHLVDVTRCLLTELFFLMRQNMLLRIRAHIIRSFCSCKCMWRWCKTTGRRIYRESGKNKKNCEWELLIESFNFNTDIKCVFSPKQYFW